MNMKMSRKYTVALGALAVFHVAFLLVEMWRLAQVPELAEPLSMFMGRMHLLFGTACLFAVCVRWLSRSQARPVTSAVSILLILDIPLGTACFIWWLFSVRKKEHTDDTKDAKRLVRYATALYLFAFLLLNSALLMDWLARVESDEFFHLLGLLFALLVPILFSAAVLQGIHEKWAFITNHIVHGILALWIPIGSVLALIWFLAIRPGQRRLLGDAPSEPHDLVS